MLVASSVISLVTALHQMVAHSTLPAKLAINAVRLVTSHAIAHKRLPMVTSPAMSMTLVSHLLLPLLLL